MDFKKLIKTATSKVTEIAESTRSKNPQDVAIAELANRTVDLKPKDLVNTLQHSGGAYVHKVSKQDVENAKKLFGHLLGQGRVPIVGHLVPEPGGGIAIQANGVTVDHLESSAAESTKNKIAGRTPVKMIVYVIEARDEKNRNIDIQLDPGTSYP